jgi:hypothetical protein
MWVLHSFSIGVSFDEGFNLVKAPQCVNNSQYFRHMMFDWLWFVPTGSSRLIKLHTQSSVAVLN